MLPHIVEVYCIAFLHYALKKSNFQGNLPGKHSFNTLLEDGVTHCVPLVAKFPNPISGHHQWCHSLDSGLRPGHEHSVSFSKPMAAQSVLSQAAWATLVTEIRQ